MAEIEHGEYIDTYINMPSKERIPEEALSPVNRNCFLKSSPEEPDPVLRTVHV